MTDTRSTCPYCGVGCGVVIESDGAQITGVRGDPDHPANRGRLCTKGSTLHLTAQPMQLQVRALHPMLRTQRDAPRARVSWATALDTAAERFAGCIARHGADSVGFYVSGQLLTEDYYVFNKLAKGLIGTNNIDTNSRLCMSSAVAGYKRTLGADAPPACYDDIAHAQCLFIAGSNTAWAHPVLFRRIEDARQANPSLKIVVADPRRTETAEAADLHLPLLPGTDVALFHGLLHIMLWEGWTNERYIAQHTTGFDALKALVRQHTPDAVAQTCGLRADNLLTAARWFAQSPATLSLYCQGLNQSASGTDKNAALINLHLATGQIGKPGAGPFSLTGQPNAMGGREVGGMATLLSAHRDLSNAAHRAEVAALWGVPDVPAAPGKTAVEMFEAAADGEIRALWVACTNPAQSLPDQATVRRALQRAEFVVLQDCATHTATAPYADLLLPATTWGEKEGTVTNSERCISRVRAAVPAPGEAWHDWQIAAAFAQRLAPQLGRGARAAMFAYTTPEQVWAEHRSSTRGRDLDITGLSYAQLEQQPQQWPFVPGATQGRARLYEDGVFATDDGRARFAAVPYRPVAEPRDARFPIALNTGRLRDQWHGGSRTGTLGRLFAHTAEPSVQLNPQDMARRGLAAGDLVHVTSRRGSQILPAQPDSSLAPAQAFIAMHWGEEFVGGAALSGALTFGVNTLTQPVCCPHSRQPELKHAAVKVLKAELPWRLLALAWLPEAQALTTMAQLRRAAGQWAYVACVPLTDSAQAVRTGVLLRAAAYAAPPAAQLDEIERLLALDGPALLRYRDPRREVRHVMRVASGKLDAVLLAGDTQAEAWLKPLLQDEAPLSALGRDIGRALLAPGARAPHAGASRGAQVCNCHNVWAVQIDTVLARCTGDAQQRLATLQGALQCGTSCGSCLPELRRRVRSSLPEAVDTA